MTEASDLTGLIEQVRKRLGGRDAFLFHQLSVVAMSGQPCDVCLYDRKPLIEVKIDPSFLYPMLYGAGAKRLAEELRNLRVSRGGSEVAVISFHDISVIHPMPAEGFTEEELHAVDLSTADRPDFPGGMTLREMIRDCYKCESRDEQDHFLRRYLAS